MLYSDGSYDPPNAAGGGKPESAFIPLLARFQQQTGIPVEAHFGPAGLLRERIEGGAPCSVFASANRQHPQALRQAGLAGNAICSPGTS
jgi:molybdate transport system substrate-binding protein